MIPALPAPAPAPLDPALVRRYPWSQYPVDRRPRYMTQAEDHAWAKANVAFSVRWTVPCSDPRLYGWRSEGRSFLTEAAAMAAAEAPMGVAFDVEVIRWDWDKPHTSKERGVRIYFRKNANAAKRRRR